MRNLELDRRDLLIAGVGAAVSGVLTGGAVAESASSSTLKAKAAAKGLLFGTEVIYSDLTGHSDYADLVAEQCSIIVPGLEAKWNYVEPEEGRFDFKKLDWLVQFASRLNLKIRMHTLVWGLAMPDWLQSSLLEGRGAAAMESHITTVVGRYRGKVDSWDVVNEITDPRWAPPSGLTPTPWMKAMGADHVVRAFALAHAADVTAKLFMNDDNLEYDEPNRQQKRDTYLKLIEGWLKQGVPIQGFGLEAHLKPKRRFADRAYRQFLAALAGLGLEIYVTELDVDDDGLPDDVATRDRMVADYCRDYLNVVLDEPAVKAVLVWPLSDRYSYLNQKQLVANRGGRMARANPYDDKLQPKPMRDSIAAAFDAAPKR